MQITFRSNWVQAKYQHITIPYPTDSDNRLGAAEAEDLKIKKIRDSVLEGVAKRTGQFEKDRTFFRRLPQARHAVIDLSIYLVSLL